MGSKWQITTLGDIALGSDGAVDGPFGSNLPASSYVESGIPVIRGSNLSVGLDEFKDNDFVFISETLFEKLSRNECIVGDIIFTKKGTLGQTGLITARHKYSKYLLSSNQMRLRVDPAKAIPEYVYYWVSSQSSINKLIKDSECTGVPKINLAYLKGFPISLPDLTQQQNIISILQSLNNKITLNRQINQTLEQMAQTLFKSWFVDFDPVIDNALDAGNDIPDTLQERAEQRRLLRAKADIKPLPAETRALFPSEFAETELGWVPKGWEPTTISKTFDVTMGQSPPGSTYNEDGIGMPFFQGKTDFGFRYPTNRVYCSEPKRFAEKDDTLMSVRAPVGDANMAVEKCAIGRGVASIRHKSSSSSFTYYSIKNLSKQFDVFNGEGTVFGSINQKDMNEIKLLNIPKLLIHQFDILASTIDKKIEVTSSQIDALTKIRDSMLPKLISGELELDALPETPELIEAL